MSVFVEPAVNVYDVFQLLQEPVVYHGFLVNLLYAVAHEQCFREDEYAHVGGFVQGLHHVLHFDFVVVGKAVHPLAYHPQSLLQ